MPIIHITDPAHSEFAATLRSAHLSKPAVDGVPMGALIVNEGQDGEPRYLLEKLMFGEALGTPGTGDPVPKPADQIAWKNDPLVVLVGNQIEMLDEFEALAPGFTKKFGPAQTFAGT